MQLKAQYKEAAGVDYKPPGGGGERKKKSEPAAYKKNSSDAPQPKNGQGDESRTVKKQTR